MNHHKTTNQTKRSEPFHDIFYHRYLQGDTLAEYLRFVRKMAPREPVIHIDDSDVIKPEGYHFESLGIVRDGSRSTPEKSVFCKGYHVTEACVLTDSNHPVSIFSELHSSMEKNFTSTNHITFAAMERGTKLFKKATYVMDRCLEAARPFKSKVLFIYYRISDRIAGLMRHAIEGIQDWFRPKRPNQMQLRFRLLD